MLLLLQTRPETNDLGDKTMRCKAVRTYGDIHFQCTLDEHDSPLTQHVCIIKATPTTPATHVWWKENDPPVDICQHCGRPQIEHLAEEYGYGLVCPTSLYKAK